MISLADARKLIIGSIEPRPSVWLSLSEIHGRILRQDISSPHDFPLFDRSAMDGYAVCVDDASERFRVIGEVQPGYGPDIEIAKGECARIFTGAAIPRGASQVIVQEEVSRDEEWMVPLARDSEANIRRRGEEVLSGARLLAAGTRIGAGEAAMLAQIGAVEIQASAAPRVLHLVTGNELVDPGTAPARGEIRDSNSTLISALLKEDGAELVQQKRCGDDLATVLDRIRSAPEASWDLLLISGGASVGEYDFGRLALAELGFQVQFDKVAMRPGKPLIFATRPGQAAFVIPGNPVAHFVTFHVAIRTALDRMQAAPPRWPLVQLPLSGPVAIRSDRRETCWPARLAVEGGRLVVNALRWQSSGDLCGIAGADALIRIPSGEPLAPGEPVEVLLLKM